MTTQILKVRKVYKYRLYQGQKKDKVLLGTLRVAGKIWNHCVALQKRYYRLFKKYISEGRLKKHISYLRMKSQKYAAWKQVGSQAVQDIIERLDNAYQRFFLKEAGLPRFKKSSKYKSFTLKQNTGWELLADRKPVSEAKKKRGIGQIKIGKEVYKFVKHRELKGKIKTLTIKQDSCGRLWLCFSVEEEIEVPESASTSRIGGFDFGLKTFLTDHTGRKYPAPEYLKHGLAQIRLLNRAVSRKVVGSENRKAAKWQLARSHIRIADKRRDFHFKLAHELCKQYDILVFEDLNIEAMKRLWGRKVSDLGFTQFLDIVKWLAVKQGKIFLKIERFMPTTQICSNCGQHQRLSLKDRVFACNSCGLVLDRDHNAAINIQQAGASASTKRDLCKTSV